ncbi:MAG: tripartite tricarboxylate transporter TctB family protein [Alphaproteobacteria bacterium]|nr:tripartite tricarboxylate transporter TctB family protein [Alphaproteobacteria bacterium]
MNAPSASDDDGARPWWLGIAVILIGGFWIYGSWQLPATSTYARIGPGMFVMAVGIGLVVFGALLLVQIARGERFEPQEAEDAVAGQPASMAALATVLIAAALPLYTMERFGFVPTSALVFAATTRAFGSRRVALDLAIGAVMGACAWYGFSALGVELGKLVQLPTPGALLPRF